MCIYLSFRLMTGWRFILLKFALSFSVYSPALLFPTLCIKMGVFGDQLITIQISFAWLVCLSISWSKYMFVYLSTTRITLQNEGQVAMDYKCQVVMDNFTPLIQRSVTFMSEGERPESRVDVVDTSYVPFIVEPSFGRIPAGKTETMVVKFAPLDANEYEGRLICR